jgi:hypothetical protein
MKYRVLALFLLVIAAAAIAGCTQGAAPAPAPAQFPAETMPVATAEPRVTFPLDKEYLHKKYSFTSEKDVFTEQLRVTGDPWAIDITVNPTSTDLPNTWFEITAVNLDNSAFSQKVGYGGTYSYDRHQQFPMYNGGPYTFEMKGNLVSVDVIIATRKP